MTAQGRFRLENEPGEGGAVPVLTLEPSQDPEGLLAGASAFAFKDAEALAHDPDQVITARFEAFEPEPGSKEAVELRKRVKELEDANEELAAGVAGLPPHPFACLNPASLNKSQMKAVLDGADVTYEAAADNKSLLSAVSKLLPLFLVLVLAGCASKTPCQPRLMPNAEAPGGTAQALVGGQRAES
ncbi:MAG: hypothetical protein ACYTKD_29505, partial [Planctomycetota bacterium]